jgi:hypothetical protein
MADRDDAFVVDPVDGRRSARGQRKRNRPGPSGWRRRVMSVSSSSGAGVVQAEADRRLGGDRQMRSSASIADRHAPGSG